MVLCLLLMSLKACRFVERQGVATEAMLTLWVLKSKSGCTVISGKKSFRQICWEDLKVSLALIQLHVIITNQDNVVIHIHCVRKRMIDPRH